MKNKLFPQKKVNYILSSFFLLLSLLFTACAGQAPEASKAHSRAVINAGAIVPAEEIRVAEYLQYYEQNFPEPEREAVGLDLRLGNNRMPDQGGVAWLQVGLQARSAQTDLVAPLNVALVIDRSGSMDTPDKMPYVKQALRTFLEGLNPQDVVSIVVYSDAADLLLPAQPVGDGRWIQGVIERIQPGGGTNLHAGMMLGFQEVDKAFDVRRNNRVILLTDGIANQGVTDPTQIAADALAYNERGIYLSTIGLGLEFNDALLSQLARQGKGGYSFIDSAQEIERVFREHVAGLKQRVADEINLTVIPEAGVRLIGLTGLEGLPPAEGANIPLAALGTGDSWVLLAQLQVDPAHGPMLAHPLARVQLRYFDEFAQRPVMVEQTVSIERAAGLSGYDPLWDLELLRNVTIQQTAEGMREIDRLFQAGRYEPAWQLAVSLEQRLGEAARLSQDQQLLEDVKLMQRYQQTLADALWQSESRQPRPVDMAQPSPASRPSLTSDLAFPTPVLPTVEIQ